MSPRHPVLACALAALLVLAGCVSGSDGDAARDVDAARTGNGPERLEDRDARGNATANPGSVPHAHDYWTGRERVTLFDDTVEPETEEAVFWTAFGTLFERTPGRVGGTFLNLPEGAIVYEGTGEMVITASWSDPAVTSLAVSYRSAASREFTDWTPLPNGEAVTLSVAPEETDLPHSTVSRWQFAFAPDGPGALLGPFDLWIDIVKTGSVEEFPAHPDVFSEGPAYVFHDAPGRSEQVSYAARTPNLILQGQFGEDEVVPEDLVPMGSRSVRADVTLTKAESSVGEVSEIRLYYRSASSYQYQPATHVSGTVAGGGLVYALVVDEEDVDSPYADESQWAFVVEAATSATGAEPEPTCGGCFDTDIEFHLTLTAFDHDWRDD